MQKLPRFRRLVHKVDSKDTEILKKEPKKEPKTSSTTSSTNTKQPMHKLFFSDSENEDNSGSQTNGVLQSQTPEFSDGEAAPESSSEEVEPSSKTIKEETPETMESGSESILEKRRVGRPRKVITEEEKQLLANKPKRGRGRPKKTDSLEKKSVPRSIASRKRSRRNTYKTTFPEEESFLDTDNKENFNADLTNDDDDDADDDADDDDDNDDDFDEYNPKDVKYLPKRTKRVQRYYDKDEPTIPLSKIRPNGSQKPLTIDMERLVTDSNRDKRYKVNTLDVLKHLLVNFEPTNVKSHTIKPEVVHKDFRTHLLNHIHHLFDIHGNIDDLQQEILRVQRQKQQIRRQVFEIRKDHANVGNQLNELRSSYNETKDKYNEFKHLNDGIKSIEQQVNSDNDNTITNLSDKIDNKVFEVGKVYHPNTGLAQQLSQLNGKLLDINGRL